MSTINNPITPPNTPNNTQNFLPADEKWELQDYNFAASVVIPDGYAVGWEIISDVTTGNLTLMGTENANGADFVGIMSTNVQSTDPDFATAGKVKQVLIPVSPAARATFSVTTGTLTPELVGSTVAFSSDSSGLDVTSLALGARIVGMSSATNGICTFNMPTSLTS